LQADRQRAAKLPVASGVHREPIPLARPHGNPPVALVDQRRPARDFPAQAARIARVQRVDGIDCHLRAVAEQRPRLGRVGVFERAVAHEFGV